MHDLVSAATLQVSSIFMNCRNFAQIPWKPQ